MALPQEVLDKFVNGIEKHLGKQTLISLERFSDRIHQIDLVSGESESHASVRKRTIRVAQALTARGVGVGDVMIVCGNNHSDVVIPLIASMYIGTAVMPLSTDMTQNELKHLLSIGKPDIIFCDADVAKMFNATTAELGIHPEIVIFGELPSDKFTPFSEFLKPTEDEDMFQATEFDPATTTSFIVCSSGTTGMPKGVCLTHKNLAVQILLPSLMTKYDMETEYGILLFSTYVWLSGIIVSLHCCIFGTTRIHTTLPFSPELAFDAVNKYKPKSILLSPISVTSMLQHPGIEKCDFSTILSGMCIGSSISYEKLEEFQKYLKNGVVGNFYGMSEVSGTICSSMQYKRGSCGKPMPWIKCKIVDVQTEEDLGPNEVGEIRLKTSLTLFKEYYNNHEATAATFDSDGWFKTGDLAYADEAGDYFIVDRIKEMLKYRNVQVAPAEIELEICKIPGVLAVCVVGLPHPHDGDHPAAIVQLQLGAKLTEKDITDVIKKNLSYAKQLRGGIIFLDEIPATHSGKIDRKTLKKNKMSLFRNKTAAA